MLRRGRSLQTFVRGFRALVARSKAEAEGGAAAQILDFDSVADLPKQDPLADVEVAITHSDLNYKDALIGKYQCQWPGGGRWPPGSGGHASVAGGIPIAAARADDAQQQARALTEVWHTERLGEQRGRERLSSTEHE